MASDWLARCRSSCAWLQNFKCYGFPRRTEEMEVTTRGLPFGWSQFITGLPDERGPFDRSLWLTSDGFFYVLKIMPAYVTSSAYVTPTMILTATCRPKDF